jgi:hypothetical protein
MATPRVPRTENTSALPPVLVHDRVSGRHRFARTGVSEIGGGTGPDR